MNVSKTISEIPTKSTDFSSFFITTNKLVFTSYGPSRLVVFDQVNAYIISVEKGLESVYTCLSVIALEPLPEDDAEIGSIAINHDFTKAALIGRRNVYTFVIPNSRGSGKVLRVAGQKRLTTSLITIGPLPSLYTVVKAAWLQSSVTRENQKFADVICVLFSDNIVRVYDVKYPQKETCISFHDAIVAGSKENLNGTDNQSFVRATSLGLSKAIVSFDLGILFDEKTPFFTVFAIDNDSALYYSGVVLFNGELTTYHVTGPVSLKRSGGSVEPLDLSFIEHKDSDCVTILAVIFDDASVANIGGFQYLNWDNVLKGKECMRFFTLEILEIDTVIQHARLIQDRTTLGEYLILTDQAVFMVSIETWHPKLSHCVVTGSCFSVDKDTSVVCHCFQLIADNGTFQSVAILADSGFCDKNSRLKRYLMAIDTEGQIHGRFIPRLHMPLNNTKKFIASEQTQESTPEKPQNATTYIATNIPKLKNKDLEQLDCLKLFTMFLRALEEQVTSNISHINNGISKCGNLTTTHSEQNSAQQTYLDRIVTVADQLEALQPQIDSCLPVVEKLSNRMERIYAAIPREQLTKTHIENEELLYKTYAEIQQSLTKASTAAIETATLRSDYVRRQPSFTPSISGTRFMLTKASLDADVLKTEIDKLTSQVEHLNIIAEMVQRTSSA